MSSVKFAHQLSKHLVDDLMILTDEDLAWQKMKPISDLDRAYRLMSILFVKYILITNSFTKLANMIVTYQKRERLKPILSNLHGRILELNAEMAKMKKTDLPYLDHILMSMEMSRRDIELEIPEYYRMERSFVVKEFFRFTEKIKSGLVLKQFPKKPVPELALDLRKYYLADAKLKEMVEAEDEGRRIEQKMAEEAQRSGYRARGIERPKSAAIRRPPRFEVATGRGEIWKIMQLMGNKREKVYQAMRTVLKQPMNEPYESWKFPFSREVVRAPYFQGKKYFHGYNLLTNVVEYGKFITAIALLQKHERARYGGIYFMIMKERNEKMFAKMMDRKKGVKTVFKTVEDFRYPIKFRDPQAVQRQRVKQAPADVRRLHLAVKVYGLLPEPSRNPEFCAKYHQYKSNMRKAAQKMIEDCIKAEAQVEEESLKYENWKELDIIEEILEYFRVWLQASKPLVARYGWDLMDIPDPHKKVLPPPNYVAGIPKVLTDQYIKQNFTEITNVVQRPPPLSGTALIVSGNHITPEQYMACKPLGLARAAMSKEAREAELKKLKEQEKKMKEKKEAKKGKEEEGYKPQKSQIPMFVMQRMHDLRMAHEWEEVETHPMIRPKLLDVEDLEWRAANKLHFQLREAVDKKMIAMQKDARQKMIKKHRKAENLKKRNLPAMKKPKKEWALGEHEKWEIVYALAKEGYFMNFRNKILSNMPGTNIFSFSNPEWIEEYLTEPEPAWGDLYQLVKLCCILPLADLNIRQYGPLVSAVGFVGPREVINRLVCAVAHETGSIVIHIDPHRPEGDIPLNQLANMITKLAKAAQPTIILVDDCHLVYRKKEKGVTSVPSPYTKVISKIKKGINKKFKVLMIGATDRPDLTNPGKMSKVFDKVVPFPHKDYHATADYWGKYLFENDALARNFPYPALVEPTNAYRIPAITQLFTEQTMTSRRKKDLALTPLKMGEFLEPLIAAKATETTPDSLKVNPSGYAWASSSYKSFKARKKMLKALLDERKAKMNEGKDKKKKK